jgi:hypothetical protein
MGLFGLFLVRVLMKHLLTFLILFGFIGHGLSQVQAVSFRDYNNCTYGFRIGSKEVWPPVFELAYPCEHRYDISGTMWIVKKDGYTGALDPMANQRIPCVYDSLIPTFDTVFIAIKKGKYGLVSFSGLELSAFRFKRIMQVPYTNRFKFQEGNLWGLFNTRFEPNGEAKYTEIETCTDLERGVDGVYAHSYDYFVISQEKRQGIMHIDRGELVAPQFSYIESFFAETRLHLDPVFNCFTDSTTEIRSCDPKVFSRTFDLTHQFRIVFPQDVFHPEDRFPRLVILNAKTQLYAAIDLLSGKQSNWYQQVEPYGLHYVVSDQGRHVLLNPQFQEVYGEDKSYFTMPGMSFSSEDWFLEWEEWEEEKERQDGIIPFYTRYLPEQDSATSCSYLAIKHDFIFLCRPRKNQIPHLQIVLLETGSITPKKYDLIDFMLQDDHLYFWCYNFAKDKKGSALLTILNEKLEIIKKISCYPEYARRIFKTQHSAKPDFILVNNTEDKMGSLRPDGSIVIPFIYHSLELLQVQNGQYKNNTTRAPYLLGCLDDTPDAYGRVQKVLLSPYGEQLLPITHTNYVLYSDSVLLAYSSDPGELYDKNLRLIQKDCRDVRSLWMLDKANKYKFIVTQPYQSGITIPAVYYVYDGILYCYAEGKIQRMDDTYFSFSSDSLVIFNHYIIDRSGKVIGKYTAPPSKPLGVRSELQPIKSEFIPVERFGKKFHWKPEVSPNGTSKWYLFDSLKRNKLYDYAFDFPITNDISNNSVCAVNGKFGLFGTDFTLLLLPEYDFIYAKNGILVNQQGQWRIFNPANGAFSMACDAIGLYKYKTGRFIFRNDSIAFIDDSFCLTIPFQTKAQLMTRKELTKLCQFGNYDHFKGLKNLNFDVHYDLILERSTHYFEFANAAFLVELQYVKNTREEYLEMNLNPFFPIDYAGKLPNMYFSRNTGQHELDRRYMAAYDGFYSHITTHSVREIYYERYSGRRIDRLAEISSGTYWLRNGKVQVLTLKQVIKQDARSQELLKELIYKGLNEKQFPGVNCVEIERLLKTYNTQFYVGTNGLNLYLLTNGEQQVFAIPFRALASILNPELKAHLHKGFYL